jgi:hypothetical protein
MAHHSLLDTKYQKDLGENVNELDSVELKKIDKEVKRLINLGKESVSHAAYHGLQSLTIYVNAELLVRLNKRLAIFVEVPYDVKTDYQHSWEELMFVVSKIKKVTDNLYVSQNVQLFHAEDLIWRGIKAINKTTTYKAFEYFLDIYDMGVVGENLTFVTN